MEVSGTQTAKEIKKMTNYFENCKTSVELKNTYKELVKKFHPDIYGEKGNEILKEIHNQLEKATRKIDKGFFSFENDYLDYDKEESEEIKAKKEQLAKELSEKYKGFAYQYLFVAYWQNNLRPANHRNPLTKHNFSGWNVWQLELKMLLNGYKSAKWSTFAQYNKDNNSIMKGQKGTQITLAIYTKGKEDEETGEKTQGRVFYKGYSVFNAEQTKNGATAEEQTPVIEEVKQIETKLSLDAEKIEKAKESHKKVKQLFNDITEQKTLNLWDSVAVVA